MAHSTHALYLALALAAPAVAQAQQQEGTMSAKAPLLRPGTRPMTALFSVAPALALDNNLATQVKLAEGFAWHLSGDSSGFAVGGELQESIGGSSFVFNAGPKAWYDIQISDSHGFYLSPSVMMGLVYASGGNVSTFGFDMQFGFEAKLVIQDRGVVFFRPITVDIAVADGTAVRWDLAFGGGVTF